MALSECSTITDEQNRELTVHGTAAFPIACYHDDLSSESVPWHWHDELEAVVVESGSTAVQIGPEEIAIEAGDGFFINAGILHACREESAVCRYESIVFSPTLVGGAADSVFWEKYLTPVLRNRSMKYLHLRRSVDWEADALSHIGSAWRLCEEEPEAYEIDVRSHLTHLLALLAEHRPEDAGLYSVTELRSEERVKEMLGFVSEHYGEEIDVRAIAGSASVSESECLRCFRAVLGTTPVRYLRQYRLQRAEELLRTTPLLISEIGDRCGFREMSYFARSFREAYGIVPSEYALKMRGGGAR